MTIYITADNHIDDIPMLKYRPWFKNIREHNEATWNLLDQLKPDDQFICLGDGFLTRGALDKLSDYPFKKALIPGNHEFDYGLTMKDYAQVFDDISGPNKQGNIWLTHIPMHPSFLKRRRNIHGHGHRDVCLGDQYINVSLEGTRFNLLSLEEIVDPTFRPFRLFKQGEYRSKSLIIKNGHVNLNTLILSPYGIAIGELVTTTFRGDDTHLTLELGLEHADLWDEDKLVISDNNLYLDK